MADTKTVAPQEGPGTRFWNWLTETQIWTSVFRHGRPDTDRNRVLVMLSNVFLHLHPVRIRKSGVKLRYTWCMGGLSFFLFLVLTFTGLLLMFYYRPTLEYAYTDIVGLREHVPLGIMREMHRWGAHAMVITVWLHMFRVFMTGCCHSPATCCPGISWRSGRSPSARTWPARRRSSGTKGPARRCSGSVTCLLFTPRTMRGLRCLAAPSSVRARCCGSTCFTVSGCRSGSPC